MLEVQRNRLNLSDFEKNLKVDKKKKRDILEKRYMHTINLNILVNKIYKNNYMPNFSNLSRYYYIKIITFFIIQNIKLILV